VRGGDDPLMGAVVGNYRLIAVLGEGGMGRVYAAAQPQIAARAAIKVLTSQAPDLVARFFAEARAVNTIKHPSIVKVFDLSHLADGRPYIIMELVEGETLRTLVRRDSPLPLGGVLRVMGDVLGALGAAHAQQIVHRDLKPDNVMVTPGGGAKVLDFGIAKLSPWLGDAVARTQTGARVGTPAYMSPEQIRGVAVDARTDVYAAGVLLFEACTGQRPFRGESEFELLKGHMEEAPPSPRALRAEVPPQLEQIILHALAKRPEERFQSTAAMANALGQVAANLPPDQQRPLVPRASNTIQLQGPLSQSPTVDDRSPRALATSPPTVPSPGRGPSSAEMLTRNDRSPGVMPVAPIVAASGGDPARRRTFVIGGAAAIAVLVVIIAVAAGGGSSSSARASGPRGPTAASGSTAMPGSGPDGAPGNTGGVRGQGSGANARVVTPTLETWPDGSKHATKPIDFDEQSFDPVAYLPKAEAFARTLVPDAQLTTVISTEVAAGGVPNLTGDGKLAYLFYSPAAAKDTSGVVRLCAVAVNVTDRGVSADTVPTASCALVKTARPTCSYAQLWARARAKGATDDMRATITWAMNQWSIYVNRVGSKPLSVQLNDRCGGTAQRTPAAATPATTTTSAATAKAPVTTAPVPPATTTPPAATTKPPHGTGGRPAVPPGKAQRIGDRPLPF
jgi:serine/threonine protein kinase